MIIHNTMMKERKKEHELGSFRGLSLVCILDEFYKEKQADSVMRKRGGVFVFHRCEKQTQPVGIYMVKALWRIKKRRKGNE